jgi:hypothetical protein
MRQIALNLQYTIDPSGGSSPANSTLISALANLPWHLE